METAQVIGLDTNLLVRFYAADDPAQTALAKRVLEQEGPFFVPKSVLLELFWVLTSVHETPPSRLLEVLKHLLALEHVRMEDEEAVASAVESYARGVEFSDALHLSSCQSCDRMLTFDRTLAKRAKRLGLTPTCEVPT